MRTVTRRGFFGGCLGLAMAGCLSPTLPPLPPPNAPSEMTYLSDGQLQLSGSLPGQRGLVFALNLNNDKIAGEQVRERRYTLLLEAEPGDAIELWYELGADQSDVRRFLAPEYPLIPADAGGGDTGNGEAGNSGESPESDSGNASRDGSAIGDAARVDPFDAAVDAD